MKLLFNGWHKISEIKAVIKGKEVTREFLHLKSAVGAVVTDENGNVGLVQQYRPTLAITTLEIPAGVLDKVGITPLGIIYDELKEECNIKPSEITEVNSCNPSGFYMVTGSSDAYMHMFRIKVVEQPEGTVWVDDADVDCVKWISFERFEKLVLSGEIVDNKTIMAYYILKGEQV